ncbi:hypothetical protein Dimus_006135 [Dionaea muscipula]
MGRRQISREDVEETDCCLVLDKDIEDYMLDSWLQLAMSARVLNSLTAFRLICCVDIVDFGMLVLLLHSNGGQVEMAECACMLGFVASVTHNC